jgi:hypothetical protein
MKHLTSALAIASLLVAVPALASDISSDRYFAEKKASASQRATPQMPTADAPEVKGESYASRCTCARSDGSKAARAEPGGR